MLHAKGNQNHRLSTPPAGSKMMPCETRDYSGSDRRCWVSGWEKVAIDSKIHNNVKILAVLQIFWLERVLAEKKRMVIYYITTTYSVRKPLAERQGFADKDFA
jgi:hypothetical protein